MPVLRGDQIDVAMDHESLRAAGTLIGTGGAIVMDDRTCMVRTALVVARFFEHESCGQCTQCREGTGWTYKTLSRIESGERRTAGPPDPGRHFRFHGRQMHLRARRWRVMGGARVSQQFRADFEATSRSIDAPFRRASRYERPSARPQRDRRYPRHARPNRGQPRRSARTRRRRRALQREMDLHASAPRPGGRCDAHDLLDALRFSRYRRA